MNPPNPAATAAELRAARAQLVADLTAGTTNIAELGDDPDAGLVKTVVLAQAVPGVGKVRSRHILAEMGIADGTRWGELDAPTRRRLVEALLQPVVHDE